MSITGAVAAIMGAILLAVVIGGGTYHYITVAGYKTEIASLQSQLETEKGKTTEQFNKAVSLQATNVQLTAANQNLVSQIADANARLADVIKERNDKLVEYKKAKAKALTDASERQQTVDWLNSQLNEVKSKANQTAVQLCATANQLFDDYMANERHITNAHPPSPDTAAPAAPPPGVPAPAR